MSRRFGYFHLIVALMVGLVLGLGLAGLPFHFKKSDGPWEDWKSVSQLESAINECLVKEMRGQPSNMIATVYALCAERDGR
jgi:hypothetical protein